MAFELSTECLNHQRALRNRLSRLPSLPSPIDGESRPLSWPIHFARPHSPPITAYSKTISYAYVRLPVPLGDVTLVFLRELTLTPTSFKATSLLKDSSYTIVILARHYPLPLSSTNVLTRSNTGAE